MAINNMPPQNSMGANTPQPQSNPQPPQNPGANTPVGANMPPQGNPNFRPPPPPSPFGASIPGQSLTDTPKNSPWEHPPKYTNVHDALNFLFDQLVKPLNLKQTLMLLSKGVSVEDIVRMLLFSGFSQGLWTPDLGMLMARPLTSIVAGIAHRAGNKDAKMTREDRSGFKHLLGMQKIRGLTSTTPEPPTMKDIKLKGLMAPNG